MYILDRVEITTKVCHRASSFCFSSLMTHIVQSTTSVPLVPRKCTFARTSGPGLTPADPLAFWVVLLVQLRIIVLLVQPKMWNFFDWLLAKGVRIHYQKRKISYWMLQALFAQSDRFCPAGPNQCIVLLGPAEGVGIYYQKRKLS